VKTVNVVHLDGEQLCIVLCYCIFICRCCLWWNRR